MKTSQSHIRRTAPNGLRHYQRVILAFVGLIRRGSVASGIVLDSGCGVNALSGLHWSGWLAATTLTITPDAYLPYSSRNHWRQAFMQLLVQRSVDAVNNTPTLTAGRSPTSFAQRCTCL